MSEQWPAGYDFLLPQFKSSFIISAAGNVSDGVVVPVQSRVEAIIVHPTVLIEGLGGVGTNFQVKVNEATADGPSFNLPEDSPANRGRLLRPTDFVYYALLPGDFLQVEADGLQIAGATAFVLFITRPI